MQVIIRKKSEMLPGQEVGTTVEVKPGFATNCLIPRGLVFPATPAYRKMVAENQKQAGAKASVVKSNAVQLAKTLKKTAFAMGVQVGEQGKIFGSVTPQHIADHINQHVEGARIAPEQVVINEPITEAKTYTLTLKLHPDVHTDVAFAVKAA